MPEDPISPKSPVCPVSPISPTSPKSTLRARRQFQLEALSPVKLLPKKQAMVEFDEFYEFTPGSQLLGVGTFASVNRAKCRQSGKFVAVKQLKSCDTEILNILRSEYQILSSLQHPNILKAERYFDYSTNSDPRIFLCLEFCVGGSVEDYVKTNGPFANMAARALFHQLLLGISYLHEKRVVHRDLKPENLLFADQDACTLKICDFGSAKKVGEQGGVLLSPNCGTRLYYAPELIFGWCWNERVDIWASGLCLCKMLVGKLPFDLSSNAVRRQLQEFVFPRVDFFEVISSLMQNLIKQCLAVDMRDRPPAMELLMHPELIEFSDHTKYGSENFNLLSPTTSTNAPWIERRGGWSGSLMRVAQSKCFRVVGDSCENGNGVNGIASMYNKRGCGRSKARRNPDPHKYFTTHGATVS